MANFEERSGNVRVRFMHKGRKISKTFKDRGAAEAWAERTKRNLETRDAAAASHLISQFPRRLVDALAACDYVEDDITRGRIPAESSCGIYFLIRDSRVIYVGKTKDVFLRLSKHRRDGKVFDSYNFIPCPVEGQAEMESNYITALMPPQNFRFS